MKKIKSYYKLFLVVLSLCLMITGCFNVNNAALESEDADFAMEYAGKSDGSMAGTEAQAGDGAVYKSGSMATDKVYGEKVIDNTKVAMEISPIKPILLIKSVKSTWRENNIIIGGALGSSEWGDAGKLKIPGGYLLVKNDEKYMYVALDLIDDTVNDPGTDDCFWFTVDVNGDKNITPYRDTNYGVPVGQPNNLARQYYVGPGAWTGIISETSDSKCHIGFGYSKTTTAASTTKHRIWEIRFDLEELGVDLAASTEPPVVKFGVRAHSTTPYFVNYFPSNFITSFSNLGSIHLARQGDVEYPSGTAGPVIGGVGHVPYTQITDGYATTDPSYMPLKEAAFQGRLDFIGNRVTLQSLWAAGARKYRIYHRVGNSGSYSLLQKSWSNYRWTGFTYVLEHFGPDAEYKYNLLDPSKDYSIDDLLMRWHTSGNAAGMHQFYARFYDSAGNAVSSTFQVLSLVVDNYLPTVDIVDVYHNGTPVPACSIKYMLSSSDGVRIKINVNDPEGHLRKYDLTAHWGDGDWQPIASDNYDNHLDPLHSWTGIPNTFFPVGEWVPPTSCAYQFRLIAYPRTTNGYNGWTSSHSTGTKHVTLMVP
ncbi:MAG: hypothetical protein GY754_22800 [bacterium]|nr:hypothetical protein [bacterium]